MTITEEELKKILIEVYKEGFYGTLDLAESVVETALKKIPKEEIKVKTPEVITAPFYSSSGSNIFWETFTSSATVTTGY